MLDSIGLKNRLRQIPSVGAVLLLSSVMILTTVLSAIALLVDLRQKELAHARGEIVSLARILSEQTTRTFEGVVLTMRGARERISDDMGRRFELDSVPVRLLLQARIAGLPQVQSLFLVDSEGFGVNSSRPDFIVRLPMAERTFVRYFIEGGQDEIFISRPEKARVDDRWTYYVSMRLLDGSGRFRGVLVAAMNIDYFESLYDSIHLDFIGRIQLLNQEGVLLAGNPHDDAMFGTAVGNPASLALLREHAGGDVVAVSENGGSEKWFVAYRQVTKYPLLIRAAVDEEEALIPWWRVVRPIAAGVILIIFFVLATTVLMVKNLLRKGTLELALKESDERLRHMVQMARDAIVTLNSARQVILFNGAAERMFGIGAAQAIGNEIGPLLSRRLRQPQCASLLRLLEDGCRSPAGLPSFNIIELQRDEQAFAVELSLSTTTFRGEMLFTALFQDLSERQRAERELLETNRQLQRLSASLQNVREEARARIARELHDELGQLLTGIRMEVSWLGGRLQPDQQLLIDKVGSVKGQIDQTIASVRRIASELRPLVLDDLGFAAAAGWYVDQFSARTGLTVTLDLPEEDPPRGDAVATALFRVMQESLTNVARHAGATRVDVRLAYRGGEWALSIRDDGAGFAHDPAKPGGIGLLGMRERAQMLGGRFSVTAAPGAGVTIAMVIPAAPRREGE